MSKELVNNVVAELNSRGYSEVEAHDVVKNGVTLRGITIQDGSGISPCIYIDDEMAKNDIDEVADQVISLYEEYKNPDIDVSCLSDHDWLLDHVYIALQRSSDEQLIKNDCYMDDIEQFLYVTEKENKDSRWSVKMNDYMVKQGGLTEEEAWEAARSNTFAETTITPIGRILAPMLGESAEDMLEGAPDMYVVSMKDGYYGAAGILNIEAIREYFEESKDDSFLIIPSSIHECIILPAKPGTDIEDVNKMIAEVNDTMVEPCEQLGDRAYYLNL